MKEFCPSCGVFERTVAQQIGGRIVFSAAGAALGTEALRNPLIAIGLAILGYKLGLYMDEQISQRCPQCGAILRATGLLP
jgi:predicted RNA-binding Zn-ribbon protein involved in translation (DUF1610 family)